MEHLSMVIDCSSDIGQGSVLKNIFIEVQWKGMNVHISGYIYT